MRIPTIDHLQSTAARFLVSLLAALLALAVLASSSAGAQEVRVQQQAGGTAAGRAKLLAGLGNHRQTITTPNALAQRFFDQGLSLAYAFNHAEAARSFREAARLDPQCAMCYWGVAFVLGPNINAGMDTAVVREAHEASQKAAALAGDATPRERAYVNALVKRYAPTAAATRASLDSAFANAMREVARSYPDDVDAATIYAEATMDLSPWYYWNADGSPRRGLTDGAIQHFRAAMAVEDGLSYMEPPYWHYPIRHSLGAVLLTAERAAEAEVVYREDLKRFPENGWSLFGLRQSLVAQGRGAEADGVARRLEKAWGMADVRLAASRF